MMDHNARSSRRNVLAFLGLAGAGASLPLQTEAMALRQFERTGDGSSPQLGNCISCKATAHALRQLADGLDSGRVIPEGVDLKSSIGARGGWLSQELRFEFYLTDEGKESTFNQKDSFEWIPDKEAAEALRLAMPRHVRVTPYPEDKSGTVTVEGLDLIRELEKNGFAIVKLT